MDLDDWQVQIRTVEIVLSAFAMRPIILPTLCFQFLKPSSRIPNPWLHPEEHYFQPLFHQCWPLQRALGQFCLRNWYEGEVYIRRSKDSELGCLWRAEDFLLVIEEDVLTRAEGYWEGSRLYEICLGRSAPWVLWYPFHSRFSRLFPGCCGRDFKKASDTLYFTILAIIIISDVECWHQW